MKKVLPSLVIILISFISISFFPLSTSACSCAELPSVEEEFARSQAVFSGKVLEVKEKRSLQGYITKKVIFEVTNTWKGVEKTQMMITTGSGGGDCGIDFKEGQEYLVYAYESTMYGGNSLVSVICDRTNELSSLQEDLKVLGEGKTPNIEVDLMGNHGETQMLIWGVVGAAVVAGFIIVGKIKKNK